MTISIRSGGHRIDWPLPRSLGRTPIFLGPDPRGEASGANISPHLLPDMGALGPVPSNGDVADPKTYSPTLVNLPSAEFGRCRSNGASIHTEIRRTNRRQRPTFQGHSRSSKMARIDQVPTIFY